MFTYTFDHTHVYCTEVEASERFFVDVLAATVSERRGTTVVLDFGGATVLLRPRLAGEDLGPAGPARFGVDHLGVRVDDVPAAAAELQSRGGVLSGPPRELRPGVFVAFVEGPDKVRVELLSRAAKGNKP
jgi:catechol 2,3-dioxygenase-like lactoylglutathione lyase family enzyme